MLPKITFRKSLVTLILPPLALIAGAGLVQANQVKPIGVERAKEIALADAGVEASKARFVTAKEKEDDDRAVYDVEFYSGKKEYDYTISAKDGRIIDRDYDIEEDDRSTPPANRVSGSTTVKTGISHSKAKEIALADVKVKEKDISHLKIESETDDGRAVYDVEFYVASTGREYDYTIDRRTGTILDVDDDMESYKAPARKTDKPKASSSNQQPAQPSQPTQPAQPAQPSPAQPAAPSTPAPRTDDDWDDWDDDDDDYSYGHGYYGDDDWDDDWDDGDDWGDDDYDDYGDDWDDDGDD